MSLPEISIRRPVTTVMITLIVIILGLIALTNLRQELMPEINFGIAVVFTTYDGAGPEEVENLITRPLETALSTVSNLQTMTTTSSSGQSMIVLEFAEGTDMDFAALRMRENIDMFSMLLPDGVNPIIMQIDPNLLSGFTMGITGPYDMVTLRSIVDDNVVMRLEQLPGVGSVGVSGGMARLITIELLPDRLISYGINPQQIAGILAAENINRPGGMLLQGDVELQVRTTGEFQTVDEIANLPLTTPRGAQIRLSDVAVVTDGFREVTSYSIINGYHGITITVTKQSIANTVEVSDLINAELINLGRDFPDLTFTVIEDGAEFIRASINNVWMTVIQATLLAIVILMLFLGNFRSPLIIGVSIPVALIASMALMYFTNLTLNMITLNALVVSVGLLIDNAIVVLESIARYIDMGMDPKEASRKGAREVSMAITVSTLTTIAVFIPVLFVGGIAGEMFGQLGLIISFTLLSSLLVSQTFVPMACSKFLRKRDPDKKVSVLRRAWLRWDRGYTGFRGSYQKVLKWALGHKLAVAVIFTVFLFLSGSVILFMGMEFMAEMDQGQVSITVNTPQGGLLDEISQATSDVLERIDGMPEVAEILVTVGSGGGSSSSIILTLVDRQERPPIYEVMEDMRSRIGLLPGVEYTVNATGDLVGGGGNSITFNLFGDNPELLADTGGQIVDLISTLPNIRNASSSHQIGAPTARVSVDRDRASHHGLQAAGVATTVNMAISGMTVTRFRVEGGEVDVLMRFQQERLNYVADLHNLMLMTPMGLSVPLSEVADIYEEEGPVSIMKINQRRYITISAEFVDTDLNSISNEISALIGDFGLPPGMTYEFGGMFEMMMESFIDLAIALLLGFVLLYMVMASQFESIAYPATILFSIPIAWTAGLFGIFIMGDNISIVSFIGLILLMGIVINNGIMLVDFINRKRREGMNTVDAILFAGPVRLRPILMTTLTTVIGLLPMLFAGAEGAEMQRP
ncbi:MAG: efflux RND transporter permease subunit, partial [Oscillospiraceae bacterium]|nr:efflux RND transporter permease subunit [Oscillospiraceae bacterium]